AFDPQHDGPGWSAFFTQLVDRAGALPNVTAAGAVSGLPLAGDPESSGFAIEGRPPSAPGQGPGAEYFVIAGDYFRAMGIRLIAGRSFTATDRAETPRVIIVSRELERRYFSGDHAIGHRLRCGCDFTPGAREIVGVVDDVRVTGLGARPTSVLRLVLGEGARIAAAGIVVGLAGAMLATRLLRGMLYDVGAADATIYAGAALIVGVVALVSTWMPARAATKVDPAVALRAD